VCYSAVKKDVFILGRSIKMAGAII
jgi:hypothetical protein